MTGSLLGVSYLSQCLWWKERTAQIPGGSGFCPDASLSWLLGFSNNSWTLWAPKWIWSSFEPLALEHMLRVHVLALFIWVSAVCYVYNRSSTDIYWLLLYCGNFHLVLLNLYVQFPQLGHKMLKKRDWLVFHCLCINRDLSIFYRCSSKTADLLSYKTCNISLLNWLTIQRCWLPLLFPRGWDFHD